MNNKKPSFKALKKTDLMMAGCSKIFARQAMAYSPIYNGDIEYFISIVEDFLEMKKNDPYENICNVGPTTRLNTGAMRVEYDYNGDVLTSLGYDYTINNRRA